MPDVPVKTRRKLIEVALPLNKINEEGSRRKRKAPGGYPTTLHKWWAQRPVAAARGITFAQLVDDPSEYSETLLRSPENRRVAERELKKRQAAWLTLPDDAERGDPPTLADCAADIERERLFGIISDLVQWDNTKNEYVLEKARSEIWQSWRRACADNAGHPQSATLFNRSTLPPFHDPFAGGGTLPLEAQRLGLDAYASDLNPVAVLINKALIELPPAFQGRKPVNSEADKHRAWKGADGLADDVRFYSRWMRDEAKKRIGQLYPKVAVTAAEAAKRADLSSYVGEELEVIAWLWVRTVRSPNPSFNGVHVPLSSTFLLSSKPGREAWVQPVIQGSDYHFEVRTGKPSDPQTVRNGTKIGRGSNFSCVMSGTPISGEYIKSEAVAGRMGLRLMGIVADGGKGRIYLSPTDRHEKVALSAEAEWKPDQPLQGKARDQFPLYGMETFASLFLQRQMVSLNTYIDILDDVEREIEGIQRRENEPGTDLSGYASIVRTYLALAISRMADYGSTLATWRPKDSAMRSSLPKQALQMTWDFAEGSPFGNSSSGFVECATVVASALSMLPATRSGVAAQADARSVKLCAGHAGVVSTDPPYYDNICYADLSDFLYVWLRRSLGPKYGELFSTLATPKSDELIADSRRHASKSEAEVFFLSGMTRALGHVMGQVHPSYPVTIYYAYKQSEEDDDVGKTRTGWQTFLQALVSSGFAIDGTWPVRTEGDNRQVGIGANALASSIVLVCRPRPSDAPSGTRRQFLTELRDELPRALRHLQRGNIAPVDLAQAAIGPGMAVFTRYTNVLDAQGQSIGVGEALARINEVLDEVLASQEGDFDPDTRWAVTWFEQFGFDEGDYGHAEQLSKAKNTAVAEMADLRNGGLVTAKRGKVKLTPPSELPHDWDPGTDPRLTVWEMVHHLIQRMDEGGEAAAAELVAKLGAKAESARELAYRLYAICEHKKRAADALPYNALVQAWPELVRMARDLAASGALGPAQAELAI